MTDKHQFILDTIDRVEAEDGPHPALEILRALILSDRADLDQREVDRLLKQATPKRPWWRFWR